MFLTCAFITLQFLEPDKNYSLTAFYYVLSLVNMHNFSPAIFSFTQLLVLQFNPGAIYLEGSKRPALVNILEREREREREKEGDQIMMHGEKVFQSLVCMAVCRHHD